MPKQTQFKRQVLTQAILVGLYASNVAANPYGEDAVSGAADFNRNGNLLEILQHTDKAIIEWQGFSINVNEITRFIQPNSNSAVLNRVITGNPSELLGNLEANGKIFLINPNGIVVGAGANINTQSFIASTLDVSNEDFNNGGDLHFQGDSTASITHLGKIDATGGDVFLIAKHVDVQGQIIADGHVGLAGANDVILKASGDNRLAVNVTNQDGRIDQVGLVEAAKIELRTAGNNPYALAINHEGMSRATSAVNKQGRIILFAEGGTTKADGTLDASAPETGDGGFIETSGTHVQIAETVKIDTSAANGETGTWLIDPEDIEINSTSTITGASLITASTIEGNLSANNVTITSNNALGGNGNVTVNENITETNTTNNLTLNAGTGGSVNVNQSISIGGDLTLNAGNGANGADGNDATSPPTIIAATNGVRGGDGGLINVNAELISTSGNIKLQAGHGGRGGSGGDGNGELNILAAGANGGDSGVGGDIMVNAAVNAASGMVTLISGNSGKGGNGGEGKEVLTIGLGGRNGGDGGSGQDAGNIIISASIDANNLTVQAGTGGQGGAGGSADASNSTPIGIAGEGGQAGSGGSIVINTAQLNVTSAQFLAGRGGIAGLAGVAGFARVGESVSGGNGGNGGRAGDLVVNQDLNLNGNGDFQFATFSGQPGALGRTGAGAGVDGSNGSSGANGSLLLAGRSITTTGNLNLQSANNITGINQLTANNINLTVSGLNAEIGSVAQALNTNASGIITASATNGTGGIFISNQGNLSLGAVNSSTGNASFTATDGSISSGADAITISGATASFTTTELAGNNTAGDRNIQIGAGGISGAATNLTLTSADDVIVDGAINAASLTATAGAGKNGLSAGANGERGGNITVNSSITSQAGNINLTAGAGGNGAIGASGAGTGGAGVGGAGGIGGAITTFAALDSSNDIQLTTGHGGSGGQGGDQGSAFGHTLLGNGGHGVSAGNLNIHASLDAGQDILLLGGSGGNGGLTNGFSSPRFGGDAGAGASLNIDGELSAGRDIRLTAGNGGGGGKAFQISDTPGDGGNGGSLNLSTSLAAGQNIQLTAGTGGAGGIGFPNGPQGANGQIAGSQIDVTATNGSVTVTGEINAGTDDVVLNAGDQLTISDLITANNISLTAAGVDAAIGSSITAVQTNASGIINASANTGIGGIFISNQGDLNLNGTTINAGTGDIALTAIDGSLTTGTTALNVSGGNLTLSTTEDANNNTAGDRNIQIGTGGISGAGTNITLTSADDVIVDGAINAASVTATAGDGKDGDGVFDLNPNFARDDSNYDPTTEFDPNPLNGGRTGKSGERGGNITVNQTITSTVGNIALTAGKGGNGVNAVNQIIQGLNNPIPGGIGGTAGGTGGSGGNGGSIRIAAALNSAADIQLTTGLGGNAGNGSSGFVNGGSGANAGGAGGAGGDGGDITTSAVLDAAQNIRVTAGAGGAGGSGGDGNLGVSNGASVGGTGGASGAGGSIDIDAALAAVAGDIQLTAGNSDRGGSGGVGGSFQNADGSGSPGGIFFPGTNDPSGGAAATGETGGSIDIDAALTAGQDIVLTSGAGGNGGAGGSVISSNISLFGDGNDGAAGGAGGSININNALTATRDIKIATGNGANGGAGGNGNVAPDPGVTSIGGDAGLAGNGGNTNINAALDAGQDIQLTTGIGGGGRAGGNGAGTDGVDAIGGTGGTINVDTELDADRNIQLTTGAGGIAEVNTGGTGGNIRMNAALNAVQAIQLTVGNGGNSVGGGGTGAAGEINGNDINATASNGNITVTGAINPDAGSSVSLLAGTSAGQLLNLNAAQNFNLTGSGSLNLQGFGFNSANNYSTVDGDITINSGDGDLTLNTGFNATSPGSGNIVLAGNNFHNDTGTNNPLSVNTGRFVVYSTRPDVNRNDIGTVATDPNAIAHDFVQYDTTFDSNNPLPSSPTGNGFFYSAQPVLTGVDVTVDDQNFVYGNAFDNTRFTFNGTTGFAYEVNNMTIDAAEFELTAPTGLTATDIDLALDSSITFSNAGFVTAGTYNNGIEAVIAAGSSFEGKGIALSGFGDLTVTQRNLNVTLAADNKVYDATRDVTLSIASTGMNELLSGDLVSIDAGTSSFATKDADLGKTVNVIGASLSGDDAANYNFIISNTGSLSADISKANLSVDNAVAQNKVYDATDAATVTGGSVTALLTDVVNLSFDSATFDNKNVSNGKTVTASYSISGTDADNYNLIQPIGLSADITKRNLTATFVANNKVYDATTAASGVFNDDRLAGDIFDIIGTTLNFDDENVANNINVNAAGLSLSGSDAGNYNLINTNLNATADITPASLDITANNDSKVFDGIPYTGGNGVIFNGFVGGETEAVLGGTLNFSGSSQGATNVGNFVITPEGLISSNYDITFVDGALSITTLVNNGSSDNPATQSFDDFQTQNNNGGDPSFNNPNSGGSFGVNNNNSPNNFREQSQNGTPNMLIGRSSLERNNSGEEDEK